MAYGSGYSTDPYSEPVQPAFRASVLGPLELVTAASGRVLSVEEAKHHLRVEIDEDDNYIDALVQRATVLCEEMIPGHRQFLPQTFDLPVEDFWEGPLRLPRPPLSSVTSLKYYTTAGTLTTLATTEYLVRTPWRQPGSIERAPEATWPDLQTDRRHPILIRFVAGYSSADNVPPTIKQAILLLVGHWYVNRELYFGAPLITPQKLEFTVESLLQANEWGSYS